MSAANPLADVEAPVLSVRDAAREHEQDRYLSALLAPPRARDDLVVIAAYLGELRRIPLITRDAAIGEIRLQWWRDTLAQAGAVSGHPVADAMNALASRRSLRRELVLAPLEGVSRELYEDGIPDAREFDLYAEETEGAAIRLALSVLGEGGAQNSERAVDSAGRALALTRLALTLPQHVAHGRLPLPETVLNGVRDPRGAPQNEAREAMGTLSVRLADEAQASLKQFRDVRGRVSAAAMAAYLPLSLIEPYLQALRRPKRDALLEVADISPLSRVTRLWFAHWRGRV